MTDIDHRLASLKTELDRIYKEQDTLLRKNNPELVLDFVQTRAQRLFTLAEAERQMLELIAG